MNSFMKIASSTNNNLITSTNNSKTVTTKDSFWKDPKSGLSFLDDKANKILNNILSDKTPQEMFLIKATMMIDIQHPVSLDKQGNVLRGDIRDFDNSKNAIQVRLKDYNKHLVNSLKGLPDELGLIKITQELFERYTKETTPEKPQFTEEIKSKNLEQFYTKDVQEKAEKIKVTLSTKDEIKTTINTPLKDALEVRN